jgi:hypothetical protein
MEAGGRHVFNDNRGSSHGKMDCGRLSALLACDVDTEPCKMILRIFSQKRGYKNYRWQTSLCSGTLPVYI